MGFSTIWRRATEGSALNFLGLGLGLMLGWAAFLSPAGLMSLSPAYHEDRRQQRLMECIQGAREPILTNVCRWTFDSEFIAARAAERAAEEARVAAAVAPLERSPEECARLRPEPGEFNVVYDLECRHLENSP